MSDRKKPVRPPCLKCGSRNVAWIQWGKPIWRDRLQEQLDRHEVTLGSCMLSEKVEVWQCNECGHRFGSHSYQPVVMRHRGENVPLYMEAQEHSWLYREKIRESKLCGCYHCLKTFFCKDINEWVDDVYDEPAPLCPYCHQDSVIGDAQGYPITEGLLKEMRDYCYEDNE